MSPRRLHRSLAVVGVVGSLLTAAACGSGAAAKDDGVVVSGPTTSSVTTLTAETSVVAIPTTDVESEPSTIGDTEPPSPPTAPPAPGGKVNINDASTSELETAFTAAGVTNARRWAREVDEYRPYTNDPDFNQLRQELGKYNIDPAILELIISTLEY